MRSHSLSRVLKPDKNRALHYEYLTDFRDFLQWREGDAILLGEANVVPEEDMNFFGDGDDRMHMMFNFYVNQHVFYALASGDARPLAHALEATRAIPQYAQWASFLRNHDELDLGRLTKEQRQLVYDKFGPEPKCSFTDAASGAGLLPCWATGPTGAGLQLDVLVARHTRSSLRRRNRNGRQSPASRAKCRTNPDAMVRRTSGGLFNGKKDDPCRSSARAVQLSSASTSKPSGATRIPC